jgi:hypothetical protein
VVVTLLILFPPAGIPLAWLTGWPRPRKIVATVISGLWLIILLLMPVSSGDSSAETEGTGTPAPSAEPSADPAAEPGPEATDAEDHAHDHGNDEITEVPDYTGENLADAIAAAQGTGYQTTSHDATDGDEPQDVESEWTVCFHAPAAGAPAARYTIIDFAVVRTGTPCPAADGATVPGSDPVPEPEPEPEPSADPSLPVSEPSLPEPEPFAHYDNCDAVRAAGQDPLYAGDPGYRPGLDRDGDGVACE